MTHRRLTHAVAEESLVSFPHRSFADQSANDASANVPIVSQVIFPFWNVGSRYRYLMSEIAVKSPVRSFPYTSFADQSAGDTSANVIMFRR